MVVKASSNTVYPNNAYDEESAVFSSASHSEKPIQQTNLNNSRKPIASIKFCIIVLISVIVLMSVLLLSAIWMGSLLPSNFNLSLTERDSEFNEIVNSVKKILLDVTHGADVMRSQIRFLLDFENLDQIEKIVYQTYLSEQRANSDLVVTIYVGKNSGTNLGIYNSGTAVSILNSTQDHQIFYNCDPDLEKYETCKRGTVPDLIQDPLDVNYIIDTCNEYPEKLVFTPGFVDVTTENLDTFYSLIYCYDFNHNRPANVKFDYFQGFDITVASASEFLINKTKVIEGSKSFIFEVSENYLVAIDNRDTKTAIQDANGIVIRKTTSSIEDARINSIYSFIVEFAKGDIKTNVACNTPITIDYITDYVSIYRLCLDSNIDWMFVLSIPKWNYMGSVIIGIVSSLFGALVIVSLSLALSIFVSIKIVKPFYNLIDQFEAVSHMDLENVNIQPSSFSEVRTLQKHFLEMTNTIKMYRAFLPQHLLAQLDQKNIESPEDNPTKQPKELQSVSSSFKGSSKEIHSFRTNHTDNSSKSSKYSNIKADMFSLFLEKKKISISNIMIDNFSKLLNSIHSPNDTIHMLTDFFDQISIICRTHGGLLGSFENDSITISFNTTSPQSKHQEKSVVATKLMIEKLTMIKDKKWLASTRLSKKIDKHLIDVLEIRAAICLQECVCGNVGTNESKNYTLISNAKCNLETMLRRAREFELKLVVSHAIQKSIEFQYHTRYVGHVKMIEDHEYSSVVEYSKSLHINGTEDHSKMEKIFEIGDSTQGNADGKLFFSRIN